MFIQLVPENQRNVSTDQVIARLRNSLATLTLGLVRMRGEYVARWPVIMATSILIMIPLIAIYAVAQRSFVRGIAVTGLGG